MIAIAVACLICWFFSPRRHDDRGRASVAPTGATPTCSGSNTLESGRGCAQAPIAPQCATTQRRRYGASMVQGWGQSWWRGQGRLGGRAQPRPPPSVPNAPAAGAHTMFGRERTANGAVSNCPYGTHRGTASQDGTGQAVGFQSDPARMPRLSQAMWARWWMSNGRTFDQDAGGTGRVVQAQEQAPREQEQELVPRVPVQPMAPRPLPKVEMAEGRVAKEVRELRALVPHTVRPSLRPQDRRWNHMVRKRTHGSRRLPAFVRRTRQRRLFCHCRS